MTLSKEDLFKLSPEERRQFLLKLKQDTKTTASMSSPIPSINTKAISEAEKRMWYLHQLNSASNAYTVQFKLSLEGQFNSNHFKSCVEQILKIHPILKSNYLFSNGQINRILRQDNNINLETFQLEEVHLIDKIMSLSQIPFDLENDNLSSLRKSRSTLLAPKHCLQLSTMSGLNFDNSFKIELALHTNIPLFQV